MHRHTSHCTRGLSLEGRLLHFLPDRPEGACWIFNGALSSGGYGVLGIRPPKSPAVQYRAHRLAFELWVGAIPVGFTIDHVRARGCTSRACCNPAHLEAVTAGENALRGDGPPARAARRDHCVNGHLFDTVRRVGEKLYRDCLTCRRLRGRKHDEKRRPRPDVSMVLRPMRYP